MGRASSTSSPSRSRSSSERGRHPTKDKPDKKSKKEKKEARRRRRDRGPGTPDTASDDVPGGAAGSTSASSTLAVALPTDNTVLSLEFVNSLASSINDLTTTMRDVQLGMQALQRESREQRGQLADFVTELQSMRTMMQTNNQRYENEMADLNKDIKNKLEQMKAETAARRTSASTSSSSGSAAAQAASPVGGGPPAARPAHRPSRLWLKGFAETLTTKALCTFADSAVARLPEHLRAGAKAGAPGFGAVVFIDFPPAAPITTIKQHLVDLKLQHKLEDGSLKDIRVTNDMPIPVRYKAKVLGELWQKVKHHLTTLTPDERPDPVQLSNNNGKLFIVIGSRPQELFDTMLDPQGNIQVNAKHTNLLKYKVTSEMADAWIVDAIASSARFAPK
jgi:hypothetical protein